MFFLTYHCLCRPVDVGQGAWRGLKVDDAVLRGLVDQQEGEHLVLIGAAEALRAPVNAPRASVAATAAGLAFVAITK